MKVSFITGFEPSRDCGMEQAIKANLKSVFHELH